MIDHPTAGAEFDDDSSNQVGVQLDYLVEESDTDEPVHPHSEFETLIDLLANSRMLATLNFEPEREALEEELELELNGLFRK